MSTLNTGATAPALPAYPNKVSELKRLEIELDLANERYIDLQANPSGMDDYVAMTEIISGQSRLEREIREVRAAILADMPEPEQLVIDLSTPTPYPVDELPKIMRDAVYAIAEKVKAPVELAGQCVIGAAVYLALTRADAEDATGGQMPINIAMLSLADSGDRKSSCHKLAFLPIHNREEKTVTDFQNMLRKYEKSEVGLSGKELKAFREHNPPPADLATIYSDATFEPLAGDFIRGKSVVFVDTSEGAQVLGGHALKSETSTATVGGMITLLDDGSVSRKRSRGNAEGSGRAYHRRYAIHMLAQDAAVKAALRDPLLRGQGFLPRFLLTAPASLKGHRMLTWDEYEKQRQRGNDDKRLKLYWVRISELLTTEEYIDAETGEVKPPVLNLTLEAHHLWLDLYNQTESESHRYGELGDVGAFASRAGDHARKLATAFAVFEKLDHVDADCMRSAVALAKHSIAEWLRYTEGATVDKDLQDAATVIDWLTDPKRADKWAEFDRDQFGKSGLKAFRPAAKRDAVLAELVDKKHLSTTDGRTFAVNPRISQRQHSAESADCAENQQTRGVESAEEVRKSADKERKSTSDKTEPVAIRTQSAPIRTESANTKPAMTGLSAQSAQSAPICAAFEEVQGELIL